MKWNLLSVSRRQLKKVYRPAGPARVRLWLEELEGRDVPATDVLSFHNDLGSTGLNAAETQLTPANVSVGSFGKLYTVPVDGQVYAAPLVKTGVTIAGQAAPKDVVFVATQHDSLYAIDSATGAILWKRSFLDITNPNNNTLGATAITTVPQADTSSTDISVEIGITGTPVIDPATNTLFLVAKTKETISGVAHYVQRLHAINIADGADRVAPFLIGDNVNGSDNNNNTPIYTWGSGDGYSFDSTGRRIVKFNALREHQRPGLTLVNGTVYVAWASHGDNGPYHGFIAKWDVSNLATQGMVLTGVFNTTPNGGLAGIWQGAGKLAFEPDGSALYFETGNGPGPHAQTAFDANGFPVDGNYYEALVKLVNDPTTSPTSQNINGWGFKVADFFIPYNQVALDAVDQDFGSGAPIVLPDSAGIPGHPHLMIAGGKEGKLYVVDRDNMGKFSTINDNVLNAIPDGSGHNTPPVQVNGLLSTPAYYNGKLYIESGYGGGAKAFTINSNGTLSVASQTTANLGQLMGSPSISANGTLSGIVWVPDRASNLLRAYDANTLATELWNSGQKAGGADSVGAVVKFSPPVVANGQVYVGTSNSLVVYGLTPPQNAVPSAPTGLTATALSGTSVSLTWSDPTVTPNTAGGYKIERSTDGVNFTLAITAPAGARSIAVGGLQPQTTYYFRVKGFNGLGDSAPSNVAQVTTTNVVATALDFSNGFASSAAFLQYNGSAAVSGTRARMTYSNDQAASVFSLSPVNVSRFSTQFTFQTPATINSADGITFTIQGVGAAALGTSGGNLGFTGIAKSVSVKFDLWDNAGEGTSSTGLYLNGAVPMNVGSSSLLPNVNLHSGNVMQVNMDYDGATLTVTIRDTVTGGSVTRTYAVNIPATVGGSTAYVGFTSGTGGLPSIQEILTWNFSPDAPTAPNAPSALGGQAASATSITLNWTNNAANQTGFKLDRANDANFTQGLVTQTLPATPNSFTDNATGLAPGGTFYYRLRAFNTAGDSANSNVVSVSIPNSPVRPTDAHVVDVGTNHIDLTWTDNAGRTAEGYRITRAVNHGTFDTYAVLPAYNGTPPASYEWSDTGVTAGNFYEYHVIAYNVAGYNDFSGTNATALTLPPGNLTATAGNGSVALSWTAPNGAARYNVYRGTTAGGQSATPIASGITTTSYTDNSAANGTTYYYRVTAVNANGAVTPPIPSESAASAEVSATPASSPPPPPTNTPALDFSAGFAASAGKLQYNGSAAVSGTRARMTYSNDQAASVFALSPVDITKFSTQFTFQTPATINSADGITFTIQGTGPTALGTSGGNIGFTGIAKSLAVKFDLWNNLGEGTSSTGLYLNGAVPMNVGSSSLLPTVDLHSGNVMQVNLSYDGTTLTVTVKDTGTGASVTRTYAVNIPATVGGNTAYVGFTSGTGGLPSIQEVINWTYTSSTTPPPPTAPATPSGLTGSATGTSVSLTWTNNATNQTGFKLDRATDAAFTQNLITRPLPAAPNSYVDTGLNANTTYYYRVRATNAVGDSANSNTFSVTTPPPAGSATLDFRSGFVNTAGKLQFNGSAAVSGTRARLTSGSNQAGTVFSAAPVNVAAFSTQFTFQLPATNNSADGLTFTIQGNAPTALGSGGGNLGFAGIGKSIAVKFDTWNNAGEGNSSTGLYRNGVAPTNAGSINLLPAINLHSGNLMQVNMTYDGTTLTVIIKDTVTGATQTQSYAVNIPATVGGNTAYVGFTSGTGYYASVQEVLTWSYSG